MEPGMEEEKFSEVPSSLTVSQQRGSPEGSAGGHVAAAAPPGGPEQDHDSFFDCRETLEEETASDGAQPRRGEGEEGLGDRRDSPGDGEEEEEEEEEGEEEGSDGDGGEEWEDLGAVCGAQGEEWRERGERVDGGAEGGTDFREDGEKELDGRTTPTRS